MGQIFSGFLVFGSSLVAYIVLRRRVAPGALRSAIHTLLECLGAAAIFLAGNVLLGMGLVVAFRMFTPLTVSPYFINPMLLIVLSTVQGFVFWLWWGGKEHFDA